MSWRGVAWHSVVGEVAALEATRTASCCRVAWGGHVLGWSLGRREDVDCLSLVTRKFRMTMTCCLKEEMFALVIALFSIVIVFFEYFHYSSRCIFLVIIIVKKMSFILLLSWNYFANWSIKCNTHIVFSDM